MMSDEADSTNVREAKAKWLDPACAILMAITSLATAWCSYQNSRWSGETSDLGALADKREREAVALHLEARQIETTYVELLMEVIDARLAGNEKLAEFYRSRFPDDLRAAWEKWVALNPFDDPKAPPHPLVPSLYTPRFEQEIRAARAEAHAAEDRARSTGNYASSYLSNTVLLATVLFFAGTAGKFDQRRVRQSSLVFAAALFVYAAARMLMLPVT